MLAQRRTKPALFSRVLFDGRLASPYKAVPGPFQQHQSQECINQSWARRGVLRYVEGGPTVSAHGKYIWECCRAKPKGINCLLDS